jgi:ADP-ribose pyrophosphatase YjhB (NUDIX family)
MISFDTETHRFNLRAAAIIFHDEHVLLHRIEGDEFWSLPGGRVEPGEDAAATVVREMQEEIGVRVRVERMACVVENFFEYDERAHHEIGLCFLATIEPGSPLLDLAQTHRGSEGGKQLAFSWFARNQLTHVDVRPRFLRDLLRAERIELTHVVQRNAEGSPADIAR